MEIAAHLDHLADNAAQLGEAAARAAWSDPVPGCPDWTVRDLISHVGVVHRWAAAIVSGGIDKPTDQAEAAEATKPGDDGLLDWYAAGHRALVETLRSAPAEVACFAFLPAPSPLAFWARRQALETAIHRADAQAAAGIPVTIAGDLAQDGIDELLVGFGSRKREFEPGTLRLEPVGAEAWTIALTTEGAKANRSADSAPSDATVSGDAGQVYLWLWNRPADVTITGDLAVARRWGQVRVRWS